MNRMPIKVLCVDDNDLVADAIENQLRLEGGFVCVKRLRSAEALCRVAAREHPDVVLLDIDMPGKDSFQALRELSETCPQARVLMLSGLVRPDLIDRAIDSGAWGYLSKNDGIALSSAIRRVCEGEFVMGPEAVSVYAGH